MLDVRSGNEYRQQNIPGSLHIPLHDLQKEADRIAQLAPGQTLYLLCQSGARAQAAADQLCKRYPNPLVIIEGGLNALQQHTAEQQPSSGISLERQVRIAAGSLILLGVLLGTLLHPVGYALAACVGAGLVLAGATNWCGMALLLARMPWNR